jgi:hypothetical protein
MTRLRMYCRARYHDSAATGVTVPVTVMYWNVTSMYRDRYAMMYRYATVPNLNTLISCHPGPGRIRVFKFRLVDSEAFRQVPPGIGTARHGPAGSGSSRIPRVSSRRAAATHWPGRHCGKQSLSRERWPARS